MGKKKKSNKAGNELAKVDMREGVPAQGFTEVEDNILWLMAEGKSVSQMAKKLAPDDPSRQATIRRRFYKMGMRVDFQDELGRRVRVLKILGLGAATNALIRKASAGRVDAIKLLFESTGYFNPRIQHEHGGEVTITIKNAPRPERVKESYLGDAKEEPIIDADVVG